MGECGGRSATSWELRSKFTTNWVFCECFFQLCCKRELEDETVAPFSSSGLSE